MVHTHHHPKRSLLRKKDPLLQSERKGKLQIFLFPFPKNKIGFICSTKLSPPVPRAFNMLERGVGTPSQVSESILYII